LKINVSTVTFKIWQMLGWEADLFTAVTQTKHMDIILPIKHFIMVKQFVSSKIKKIMCTLTPKTNLVNNYTNNYCTQI